MHDSRAQEEALQHAQYLAARWKYAWIFGLLLTPYVILKGGLTEESVSIVSALHPGVAWLVAGLLSGMAAESLVYRSCMRIPRSFANRVYALKKIRGHFDIRGNWRYEQAASLDMSVFKAASVPLLTQTILACALLCMQWYLGQIFLLGLPITGIQTGKHLFWRIFYRRKHRASRA